MHRQDSLLWLSSELGLTCWLLASSREASKPPEPSESTLYSTVTLHGVALPSRRPSHAMHLKLHVQYTMGWHGSLHTFSRKSRSAGPELQPGGREGAGFHLGRVFVAHRPSAQRTRQCRAAVPEASREPSEAWASRTMLQRVKQPVSEPYASFALIVCKPIKLQCAVFSR